MRIDGWEVITGFGVTEWDSTIQYSLEDVFKMDNEEGT